MTFRFSIIALAALLLVSAMASISASAPGVATETASRMAETRLTAPQPAIR